MSAGGNDAWMSGPRRVKDLTETKLVLRYLYEIRVTVCDPLLTDHRLLAPPPSPKTRISPGNT